MEEMTKVQAIEEDERWAVITDEDGDNLNLVCNPDDDAFVEKCQNMLFLGSSREECVLFLISMWATDSGDAPTNVLISIQEAVRLHLVYPGDHVQVNIGSLMMFANIQFLNNKNVSSTFYGVNFTQNGSKVFYNSIPASQVKWSPVNQLVSVNS
jgi:hypothetical protein